MIDPCRLGIVVGIKGQVIMAQSTSDIKLDDLKPLSQAEQKLIDCCKAGEMLFLDDAVPDQATNENSIRGPLIRHLLLGGCDDAPAHAKGVRVQGAYITEALDFEYGETDQALTLKHCKVTEDLDFGDCRIRSIFLTGSEVAGVRAERANVDRNIFMQGKFHAKGSIVLAGAKVGGQLDCSKGQFDQGLDGNAIAVKVSVFLRDGFHAKGPVILRGARIDGQLNCSNGQFEQGMNGNALIVTASVFLRNGFRAKGPVVLLRAEIGGQLDCSDGTFDQGMNGDALVIKANVFLRNGFNAKGSVILRGAEISGQLSCIGGRFDQGLNGNALSVKGSVFLRDGFHAKGPVILRGAEISGQLSCTGAEFEQGLNLDSAKIAATFFWRNAKCTDVLKLSQATVGVLNDDLSSWRGDLKVHMNGFTYQSIESPELDVQERIDWVASHEAFKSSRETVYSKAVKHVPGKVYQPQPYRQLAKVYDDMGHTRSAALVREASEDHRWAYERDKIVVANDGSWAAGFASIRPSIRCFWARVMKWLAGYGHAPVRALMWAVGIIVFAVLFYGAVYNAGQMAPNSDVILTSVDWRLIADVPEHQNPAQIWSNSLAGQDYETFSAIGYGIDLFIPLDALGQENAWAPSKDRGMLGKIGFYLRWVIQFSGWVITAVGAATLTGLVGRK